MIPYLSCDWGTSSFRLSLVDAESFRVLESEQSGKGILATYQSWNETGNIDPAVRLSFYINIINEQITAIERKINSSLDHVPLLISGMASSSIGMKLLPYHELPFFIDGTGMLHEFIPQTTGFTHDVLLISGVKSEDDVMRGEETQLIGILAADIPAKGNKLFILPGTHSKHIVVNDYQALAFKTYMTGEFFDLLSKKSILHAGLEEGRLSEEHATKSFAEGVKQGSASNLLNSCFKVRTNSLFEKFTKKENYSYLSGLLIGAELGEIKHNDTIGIYLCCGTHLTANYEMALDVLKLQQKVFVYAAAEVEKAAMRGQYKIYEKLINQ